MNDEPIRIDPMIKAAFMAGAGHTADEIATAVGAKSPEAIGQLLALYGIKLGAKPFGARIFQIRVIKGDIDKLEPAAAARGIHIIDLIARIVATVAREISIDGLLDDRGGA